MGQKTRKPRPSAQPPRKPPVPRGMPGPVVGGTLGRAPEGCPEELAVVGSAAELPTVGQAASLTLAAGRPQLVVGGRVASIVRTRPGLEVVMRCLELGERYLGRVTSVSAGQFEASLTRGG
jgi:hypothetical protein